MSVADVLKQLQRLQWEIYEVIKPSAEASQSLREAAEALTKVTKEALAIATHLAEHSGKAAPPRPRGEHESFEVTVTGETVTWLGLEEPVMAVTIFNDGPNPVLPMVNKPKKTEQRKGWVAEGKSLDFRSSWPDIVEVFLVCKPGETATVTVHTWR